MATAQRRTEKSVSWLDLGRERWLRVGFRACGVEDLTVDDAARAARSAPAVLHQRVESQMARAVSNGQRTDVGQDDSRAVDVEHIVCSRAEPVGRQFARDGDGSSDADVWDAHRFHAWRCETIWRDVSLL